MHRTVYSSLVFLVLVACTYTAPEPTIFGISLQVARAPPRKNGQQPGPLGVHTRVEDACSISDVYTPPSDSQLPTVMTAGSPRTEGGWSKLAIRGRRGACRCGPPARRTSPARFHGYPGVD